MSHLAVSLLIFLALPRPAPAAPAADCSAYLKAASEYEELVDGLVVQKKSVFDLTDWSPDSEYEHILATDKVPAGAVLELRTAGPAAKSKTSPAASTGSATTVGFKPWALDAKLRRADFGPIEFFKAAKGAASVTLRVKNGNDVLCTETRRIGGGD